MYARILVKAQYLMMFGDQGYLNQVIRVTDVDAKGRLSMEVDVNDAHVEATRQYSSSFTELVRVGQASNDGECRLVAKKEIRSLWHRLEQAESLASQAMTNLDEVRAVVQKTLGVQV